MTRHPIIWVIGATRSSKSYLAKGLAESGRAGLNCEMIGTSDYFRQRFNKPDTYSREFVFDLSDFSAACLADDPNCNLAVLEEQVSNASKICVIEGERNPYEFAKLYDPQKDMVFFLQRSDVDTYETTIESAVNIIEQSVRWYVSNGITAADKVAKFYFGDETVKVDAFSKGHDLDKEIFQLTVGPKSEATQYPWIAPMIQIAGDMAIRQFGNDIRNTPSQQNTCTA